MIPFSGEEVVNLLFAEAIKQGRLQSGKKYTLYLLTEGETVLLKVEERDE